MKQIFEIKLKHPTKNKWFKSLEYDNHNKITNWKWSEDYDSADSFSRNIKLIHSIVDNLNFEFVIDEEIITLDDTGKLVDITYKTIKL